MDTVLTFNILLSQFCGKASSVAVFLSRMKTGPNLTLQMKPTDHVPVLEDEIQTQAEVPDVSLSNVREAMPFSEEVQPVVYEQFITQLQLKAHGLYDQFIAKQTSDNADIHITVLYSFSRFCK